MSSSSNRDEKEIDEYHDKSSDSGSSTESDSSSSESNSTNKQYSSSVPRVPLEVLQEEMRKRATSMLSAGLSTSAQPSSPFPSKEDILYYCAMDIPSKIDENRLYMLKGKYQIPDKVNSCLAAPDEWCCTPHSLEVGRYEAYVVRGLRLPLNVFAT